MLRILKNATQSSYYMRLLFISFALQNAVVLYSASEEFELVEEDIPLGEEFEDIGFEEIGEVSEHRMAQELHDAIHADDIGVVQRLIEAGVDLDFVYDDKTNPLMQAALSGNTDIFNLIRANGAKPLNLAEQSNLAQLDKAVQRGPKTDPEKEHIQTLVRSLMTLRPSARQLAQEAGTSGKAKAVPRSPKEEGLSFIHSVQDELFDAIKNNDHRKIERTLSNLLDYYASPDTLKSISNTPRTFEYQNHIITATPLHFAALLRNEQAVKALWSGGIQLRNQDFKRLPADSQKLLHQHKNLASEFKKRYRDLMHERIQRKKEIRSNPELIRCVVAGKNRQKEILKKLRREKKKFLDR